MGIDLKKFFIHKDNHYEWHEYCSQLLHTILESGIPPLDEQKIHELTQIKNRPSFTIPETEKPWPEFFRADLSPLLKEIPQLSHRKFIGHMTGPLFTPSLFADFLVSAFNQNIVKVETSGIFSTLERELLSWLHQTLFDQPNTFYENLSSQEAIGIASTGGTLGNLHALCMALLQKYPQVLETGFFHPNAPQKPLGIFVSQRGHYSIEKAAGILGLGRKHVFKVSVDPATQKIDLKDLEQKINQAIRSNIEPLALIGIAGSTETGSIDDLEELRKVSDKYNMWFHVDAAWGGAACLSSKLRKRFKGIESADSVVIDAHKFFSTPMSYSAILFRSKEHAKVLRHSSEYIIRSSSEDSGKFTLEGSRRASFLPLWATFKVIGKQNYEKYVESLVEKAFEWKKIIDESPCFQLTSNGDLNIFTYRYVPPVWYQRLVDEKPKEGESFLNYVFANNILNEINTELQTHQWQLGESFVSRTSLETVLSPERSTVLRVVCANIFTEKENFVEILKEQESLGKDIGQRVWLKHKCQVPGSFCEHFSPLINSF